MRMAIRKGPVLPNWLWLLVSGCLTILAFPPFPTGFLAYFSLLPLIYVLVRDDFHLALEKGFLFGVVFNAGLMYWLAFNSGTEWYWALLSMIASVLFLALNYALISWLIGIIGRRLGKQAALLSLPFIYAAVEFVRSYGVMGFTWNNLAYTQSRALPLIQMAAFAGTFGITLWIVWINVLLFLLLESANRRRSFRLVTILMLVFLVPTLVGLIRMRSYPSDPDRPSAQIGWIQPNVDPNQKWGRKLFDRNMQQLLDMTDAVTAEPCDLVIWPETATPTYLRKNWRGTLDRILRHITRRDVHLLTGVPDYEWHSEEGLKVYNAAFFLAPNSRRIQDYRKIQLVPMGEYVPLNSLFPSLKEINMGQGNFSPGREVKVFELPLRSSGQTQSDSILAFSCGICFESSFSHIIREGARKGSEMLVIITNDSWFGLTSGPYIHAEIARFRAIENGIPVVRCGNTGISMLIDPLGRVEAKLDFGRSGYLRAEVPQGRAATLFVKFGNWIGYLCVGITGILLIFSISKRKNQ